MSTTHTTCDGCPATDARTYRATPADDSAPHLVRYCEDCAAAYQGADMGAGGCEAQGTLVPVDMAQLARGLGRQAHRTLRRGRPTPLHLAVADALAQYPGLDVAEIKLGWLSSQAELREDYDASAIGGGL